MDTVVHLRDVGQLSVRPDSPSPPRLVVLTSPAHTQRECVSPNCHCLRDKVRQMDQLVEPRDEDEDKDADGVFAEGR